MELALFIWAVSSLDSIFHLLLWMPVAGLTATAILMAIAYDAPSNYYADNKELVETRKVLFTKYFKRATIVVSICMPIAILLPSTKTAWMMTGGYVAQNVVTSDTAKKLTRLVEAKLDAMIEEAMPKEKK